MSETITPTPRQLEAMRMLFSGKSLWARDNHQWGRTHMNSMGGAVRRMRDRMGEAGWLVVSESAMGRLWYRNELTSAGLTVLREHHPELEGIDARIANARAKESAARVAEEEALAKVRREVKERAERRKVARAEAFRAIMQDYQIRHDLTDDQCRAIWLAIVEKEHDL